MRLRLPQQLQRTCVLALCAWGLGLAWAQPPAARLAPETVQVPVGAWSSAPQPLQAWLYPPRTGQAARPAVVMVHGCGGAYGKDGDLNARHRMWGEYLAAHGYAALMLDSFGARGIDQICTTRHRERSIKEADRVGDAYAAQAYLRSRSDVDPQRIAILGWSHGGGVVLDTISRPVPAPDRFAAAVSFYPGCTARNAHADTFHPYRDLLLVIGEADDWTPAAPCKALAATVAARGEPMTIITYPNTYHDFDNPALKAARVRKEVPNGVHPGEGVTVAPNPQAREDAQQRVLDFLNVHLGP